MSSGNLPRTAHPDLFRWSADLDPDAYVRARYRVGSLHDAEATAIGMAIEQSAATTAIAGHVQPSMLVDWTIRVVSMHPLDPPEREAGVAPYHLATEVYADGGGAERHWAIELAIPRRLLAGKPAQLWNVVLGELPRLGFLTRFQLEGLELPAGFGPGPAFGVAGIRERFGVPRGPLLCRSMRPAVGLDIATMAALNREVLEGGFHLVKDDELQVFPDFDGFRAHVEAMVAARDAARQATGERKGYLANLICEPDELPARWALLQALDVDAALVAPALQGFGTLAMLARERRMPLLAHNTGSELGSRHPDWGIAHPVLSHACEAFGADWVVTSGEYSARDGVGLADAWPFGRPQRAMPILQGGKSPDGLPRFRAGVGSDDYMLIVASWVDAHAEGVRGGARAFRTTVDAQGPAT